MGVGGGFGHTAEVAELTFDDDFRCAPWTLRQGIDPVGSATAFDTLICVELPGPWPRDVSEHPLMDGLEVPAAVRIQAVGIDDDPGDGTVLVTRWTRPRTVDALSRSATLVGTDFRVAADDRRAVIEALVAGSTELDGLGDPAPDEILVCSHGARDRCCGGTGTRLAAQAKAQLDGLRIRRTSHLGGHRYAPTALCLPDGRMWAFLDIDILRGIAEGDLAPDEAREFYRGNTALDAWSQVVEAQMLVDGGWNALDIDEVSPVTEIADDGRSARVTLRYTSGGATESIDTTVEVEETYPVLVCGSPPEDADKTARTYRLR